jgi:hypothetical protein
MDHTLQKALDKVQQEAQAAGRPDLVEHLQGVRYIIESICKELDATTEATLAGDHKGDREGR